MLIRSQPKARFWYLLACTLLTLEILLTLVSAANWSWNTDWGILCNYLI